MVHLGVRANCLKNKVIFILARLPKPISFWFGVDDNWEKAHSSLAGWSSFRLPSIPEIVDFLIKLQIATFKCVLYFNFSTFWEQNLQFCDMETDINCASVHWIRAIYVFKFLFSSSLTFKGVLLLRKYGKCVYVHIQPNCFDASWLWTLAKSCSFRVKVFAHLWENHLLVDDAQLIFVVAQ